MGSTGVHEVTYFHTFARVELQQQISQLEQPEDVFGFYSDFLECRLPRYAKKEASDLPLAFCNYSKPHYPKQLP